jgi:hypothetical protein
MLFLCRRFIYKAGPRAFPLKNLYLNLEEKKTIQLLFGLGLCYTHHATEPMFKTNMKEPITMDLKLCSRS